MALHWAIITHSINLMGKSVVPDEEFIDLFQKHGPSQLAKILNINLRNVYNRRSNLEKKHGISILLPTDSTRINSLYPSRLPIDIENGIIMIASDCHYWPNIITPAHRGFVKMKSILKPKITILNGDSFDGAGLSRHPRIGWAQTPTVKQEIEAVMDRTHEIISAYPESEHYWTIGNHDSRLDSALSNKVPEFEGAMGFSLADQFPLWIICMSIWINDDVVIKHRFKGGVHATHNNTATAGKTMVTGHLHSLKVTPYSDYNGIRWGVDTGTLTTPSTDKVGGPQTDYNEDNPQNHRSGFVVLTFKDGVLLWPEIAYVYDDNHICFRGEIIEV